MKCEICENNAMSNNSRFCYGCAKAWGDGWEKAIEFKEAEEKDGSRKQLKYILVKK